MKIETEIKIQWWLNLLDFRWLYKIFGIPYPLLSIAVITFIGALIFGGGWWLLGQQFRKDHPNTIIDLDSKQVSTIGDTCLQPLQSIDKTNSSNPLKIYVQPVVIRWCKPESRKIAVYQNEQLRFPETWQSPGEKLPILESGPYYLKITSSRDYIPLRLDVISIKRERENPSWLKSLMSFYIDVHPMFISTALAVVGALIFGGGWWLLGKQCEKVHSDLPPDINDTNNKKGEESC